MTVAVVFLGNGVALVLIVLFPILLFGAILTVLFSLSLLLLRSFFVEVLVEISFEYLFDGDGLLSDDDEDRCLIGDGDRLLTCEDFTEEDAIDFPESGRVDVFLTIGVRSLDLDLEREGDGEEGA